MKADRVVFILASCISSLFASPVLEAADPLTLVNLPFNGTTERVATYPPSPGAGFRELAPGFSGWSSGGQIQLTLAPGYGTNGTGGVHAEVLKEGKFYQLNFPKLPFKMLTPGKVIREPLRSLQLSLDAKIPAGKAVIVHLALDVPKDVMAEAPWSKRLVLGSLRGTDAYKSYVFTGAEVPEDVLNVFINFVRDMQLNGMSETTCSLTFHLNPAEWTQGEGFLLDNVKLTVDEG